MTAREEMKDPRWLRVGDDPTDGLSHEDRMTLLDMHEEAEAAREKLTQVAVRAYSMNLDEIKKKADEVAQAADRVVVQIQEAADYWEVNL